LEEVGKLLEISPRTLQRWLHGGVKDRRKGASKQTPRKLTDAERAQIVKVCNSPQYQNLTPHQIVPLLAEEGRYLASESSLYRVLRQEGLLATKKPRKTRADHRPDELKATAPLQLWSWDISYLKTDVRGRYFYLYLFMDVFSRAIMGWEILESESGEQASTLFARICADHNAQGVTLHSDNGSPMRSSHMLATLQQLGVVASFSRPSVSNDNAFSESLFKTLKYTAGYPKSFSTIAEARAWMARFAQWYNHEHRHSALQYVTPMQRHTGQDLDILALRRSVYAQARIAHPLRWTTNPRAWTQAPQVYLKRPNHATDNVA
jgi:putative transposase